MTKIASVWVIGLAAIFAICLGFLGKFTALVSTIPNAVLGWSKFTSLWIHCSKWIKSINSKSN